MIAKILVDNGDDFVWEDFIFNKDEVKGFYLTDDNREEKSVNVVFCDGTITLKQNKELTKFLLEKKIEWK